MIASAYTQFLLLPNPHNLRLGQQFCNMYIKGSWPELFYADDVMASSLILQWLSNNQYYYTLPPIIDRSV